MQEWPFGQIGHVSALSLGGGGIGQVWGPTSQDEAIATTRAAVDAGVTLLDLAPTYGDGEAERVVGKAFEGKLPTGVRITTKCRLGNPPAQDVLPRLEQSLAESFERMRLQRVDVFFVHNTIVSVADESDERATSRSILLEAAVPAFERLIADGRIGAWGLTGIGVPSVLIDLLNSGVAPTAMQVITNLLDSPGGLQRFDGPARPRDILASAQQRGVGVMGIRAVQAGALTDAFDRPLPDDHPGQADYRRAAPFRALAAELGESPASLAHRYALSMSGVSTVVLGVKNRAELSECLAAEAMGPLEPELMARIDASVRGAG